MPTIRRWKAAWTLLERIDHQKGQVAGARIGSRARDNRWIGRADCNTVTGDYEVSGARGLNMYFDPAPIQIDPATGVPRATIRVIPTASVTYAQALAAASDPARWPTRS